MELEELYRCGCPNCIQLAESGFNIGKSVVDAVLKRLQDKGFDVKNDIDPDLLRHTYDMLNKAAEKGFGNPKAGTPDADFLEALRYSNAVFAAFKTHRQQNDLYQLMTDEKGNLKPYHQFKKDTEAIIGAYNTDWLRTEYDTAVKGARTAAEWKQYEREADLFPNVEWLPSIAVNPREAHKPYYHIIRRWNDTWWNSHYPGCLYGCQCGSTNTRQAVNAGESTTTEMKPDKGLEENPAFTGKLFSDKHPYQQQAYKGAQKAVDTFLDKNIEKPEVYVEKRYKSGGILQIPKDGKQNGQEAVKNMKAYEELSKMHAEKYRLLPVSNVPEQKNPDALNLTTGEKSDVKVPVTDNGKNAIQASIKAAGKQRVKEVYIYLEKEYPMDQLRKGLLSALQPGRAITLKHIIIRLASGELKRYDANKIRKEIKASGGKPKK